MWGGQRSQRRWGAGDHTAGCLGPLMEDRLLPLNAFISLCIAGGDWPSTLADAGYGLQGLEVPVVTTAGNVVLDAVSADPSTNAVLAAEAKSGSSVKEAQALAYSALDADAVVRASSISLASRADRIVEAAYVCPDHRAVDIEICLRSAGARLPILSVGTSVLERRGAQFRALPLQSALTAPVVLPGPPPAIVDFDELSPDAAFDDAVRAECVAAAAQGEVKISVRALTERAVRHWVIYGPTATGVLLRRVDQSAKRVAEAELRFFAYRRPSERLGEATVEVLESPERADPRGRTQMYQAIGRSRRPAAGLASGQMTFFEDLLDRLEDEEDADEPG